MTESIKEGAPRTGPGKVQDVQLLRGMAICFVLFQHLSVSATLLGFISPKLTDPFYWGVELFFVISGYVVTLSARKKDWHGFEFIIKRVFRLYPAMITLAVFAILTNYYFLHYSPSEWGRGFFPVPMKSIYDQSISILGGYFINDGSFGATSYFYGAMWSLSVEFQFYAFFTVILLLCNLFRVKSNWVGQLIRGIAILVALVGFGLRIGECLGFHAQSLSYMTGYRFDFMAVGVVMAFVSKETINHWGSLQPKYLPLLAALLPCVILAFSRSPLVNPTPGGDSLEGLGMIATQICCVYLVTVAASGRAWMIYGPLKKYLILIGDVSFTIYLMHFTIMALGWAIMAKYMPFSFATPLSYAAYQVLLLIPMLGIVTVLTYRFIELPGIAWGASLIKLMHKKMAPKEVAMQISPSEAS